jgi:hypothetical protein
MTVNEFWIWLNGDFLNCIRVQHWYNGQPPQHLAGFTADRANRLIGWPTMRQLRVQQSECDDIRLISGCRKDYSWSDEERASYATSWTNHSVLNNHTRPIQQAFEYKTGEQLHTSMYIGEHATYRAGGYVYEFRGALSNIRNNLTLLHQLNWIDNQTRAVFVHFTLYNANTQLITSVTLLFEFIATGGVFLSARFEPISFQGRDDIRQMKCITECKFGHVSYFRLYFIDSVDHRDRLSLPYRSSARVSDS